MPENLTHLLRYGTHSEKDVFLQPSDAYGFDVAVLNANIIAYTPNAMSAFVLKLNKPFLIDPQTHAFQHDFEKLRSKSGKPKQSLANLAEKYGGVIKTAFDAESSLDLNDLESDEAKNTLVQNVLDFQNTTFVQSVTTGPESEYVKYALGEDSEALTESHLKPVFSVAPYFYYQSESSSLFDLNTDLVSKTIERKTEGTLVAAQIIFARELLSNQNFRTELIRRYSVLDVDSYLLWIDGFDETAASEDELKAFVEIVTGLRTDQKEVVNLYGGYFSIMLTKINTGLSGVCHGMEYGESRQVVPVGGGLPRAKYYFPPLHKRLAAEEFARIAQERSGWLDRGSAEASFAAEVCDCAACKNPSKFAETNTFEYQSKTGKRRGEVSTSEAKNISLFHYLYSKQKEYDFVGENGLKEILDDLESAAKKYKDSAGIENTNHLLRWKAALASFLEE